MIGEIVVDGSARAAHPGWISDGGEVFSGVKKLFALVLAFFSGAYVIFGWMPDPLPLIDEAVALAIFVRSMAALGIDVTRLLPFIGRKSKQGTSKDPGKVIDV